MLETGMLETIFHELNLLHFSGELPLPKLRWNSRLASTAGRFCPGSRHLLLRREPEIEVASYLRDLADGEMHVRDTVLHEMIHYFLWHRNRPYGHTAEFHSIMKRVGAKRYNTVPKVRPVKHWYECPGCLVRIPARRRMTGLACAACCDRFNGGRFHERFRLRLANAPAHVPVAAMAPPPSREKVAPPPPAEPSRLAPSEIIRRLEDLKQMLREKGRK